MYKRLAIAIIGVIPINLLKIFLYRNIFNFDINYSVKLGVGLYFLNEMKIGNNCKIRRFNIFKNIDELILENGAMIGHNNRFFNLKKIHLGEKTNFKSYNTSSGSGELSIGKESIINSYNHFDLVASITIGKNVVFGGRGIEIWTHGYNHKRELYEGNVKIEDNVYLGSGVKIRENITIKKNITVGMGTVVSKSLEKSAGIYIGSKVKFLKMLEE